GTAGFCFLTELAQGEQFDEIIEHTNLKPSEPDALAFAAESDAVEAVIPIASFDQRQSMRTGAGGPRDGPPAMFEQRALRVGNDRNGEAFCLLGLERFRFGKRTYLMENLGLPGGRALGRGDEGKPAKIAA